MTNYHLSRYTQIFKRDEIYLLYSARTNSFYELNKDSYHFLSNIDNKSSSSFSAEEIEFMKNLHDKGIICESVQEDEDFFDNLRINSMISNFNQSQISLTFAPTASCNLKCPYCFEQEKPKGIADLGTCNQLIDFIKGHTKSRTLSLTWFGGEPLLGIEVMEFLLPKLKQLEPEIKLVSHSIITNGTLLGERAINLFKQYPLDNIQITLDGDRYSHNSKRFYADKSGTYDTILNNAEQYLKSIPDARINFRVNVDNSNSKEFSKVKSSLYNRFKRYNISVYPGILRANKGCESELFFTSKDHVDFYKSLLEDDDQCNYPFFESKGCTATNVCGYVVGPKGEIYKCWEHVGNVNMAIGHISGNAWLNPHRFNSYILKSNPIFDEKCQKCPIFPICSGGCANNRIRNIENNEGLSLCSIYSEENMNVLHDILYIYYKQQNQFQK